MILIDKLVKPGYPTGRTSGMVVGGGGGGRGDSGGGITREVEEVEMAEAEILVPMMEIAWWWMLWY